MIVNNKTTSYSVLDRCGNNWKNGKVGCGILVSKEASQTVTTAFLPWVMRLYVQSGAKPPTGVIGGVNAK